MEAKTGLVFPFTFIPKPTLDRILNSWNEVTICYPHGLEPQPSILDAVYEGRLKIRRPKEELWPPKELHRILREYKAWMAANPTKGLSAFLKFAGERWAEEETVYSIRGSLRPQRKEEIGPKEEALTWHMVLHLFYETEKELYEAQELLLKAQLKEPLKDALFDEVGDNPLMDLPQMDLGEYVDQDKLKEVIEAWLGLFSHLVAEAEGLITWKEEVIELLIGDELPTLEDLGNGIYRCLLPLDTFIQVRQGSLLGGKTIYLLR